MGADYISDKNGIFEVEYELYDSIHKMKIECNEPFTGIYKDELGIKFKDNNVPFDEGIEELIIIKGTER